MATSTNETGAALGADELRDGIERARQEIEVSVADLRNEVRRQLDVRRWVLEQPAVFFGGAFALGFLLGFSPGRRRHRR
jgi:hypothetical protein